MSVSNKEGKQPEMQQCGPGNLPWLESISEAKWTVLEGFSKVTRFYRDTTSHLMDKSPIPISSAARRIITGQDAAVQGVIEDYEAARLYVAKWDAWAVKSGKSGRKPTLPSRRPEDVWEENRKEEGLLGSFQILSSKVTANIPDVVRTPAVSPATWASFFLTDAPDVHPADVGRLAVPEADIRKAVFSGGLEHDIRSQAWMFLLEVYPWSSSEMERKFLTRKQIDEYWVLKAKWQDRTVQTTEKFLEQQSRIEKDVLRTDRTVPIFAMEDIVVASGTAQSSEGLPGSNESLEQMKDILMTYNFHNPDLGYVQGMSDLLAPIYAVLQDEVTAFWGFASFMERMKYNFYHDQTGMHQQLGTMADLVKFMLPDLYRYLEKHDGLNMFFCFRWMLIWFKREFSFIHIMRLWEVLWSDHLSTHFHYFVALAILDLHAEVIMTHLNRFDLILKYINDLSGSIELDPVLHRAETLYYICRSKIRFLDEHPSSTESDLQNIDASDVPMSLRFLFTNSR